MTASGSTLFFPGSGPAAGLQNPAPHVCFGALLSPAARLCLAAALLLLPLVPALFLTGPAGASCLYEAELLTPGPEKSQIGLIYNLFRTGWQEDRGTALPQRHLPGRGGSYALSSLADSPRLCRFAGIVLPSLYLLTASPQRTADRQDIVPCLIFGAAANALWVAENSPHADLPALLAHARAARDTGNGVITLAGTGSYTDQHLTTLKLDRAAGIKSLYLPMLGSAEAAKAVTEGRADACWAYALAGDSMPGLRPLAVASEQRLPALPHTPTFRELNVDLVSLSHFGLGVAAGAGDKDMPLVGQALADLARSDAVRRKLEGAGLIPLALTAADLASFCRTLEQQSDQDMTDYPLLPRPRVLPLPAPGFTNGTR